MRLEQLWSIMRGRRTNFRCLNASWTYYPDGDPMGKVGKDQFVVLHPLIGDADDATVRKCLQEAKK